MERMWLAAAVYRGKQGRVWCHVCKQHKHILFVVGRIGIFIHQEESSAGFVGGILSPGKLRADASIARYHHHAATGHSFAHYNTTADHAAGNNHSACNNTAGNNHTNTAVCHQHTAPHDTCAGQHHGQIDHSRAGPANADTHSVVAPHPPAKVGICTQRGGTLEQGHQHHDTNCGGCRCCGWHRAAGGRHNRTGGVQTHARPNCQQVPQLASAVRSGCGSTVWHHPIGQQRGHSNRQHCRAGSAALLHYTSVGDGYTFIFCIFYVYCYHMYY